MKLILFLIIAVHSRRLKTIQVNGINIDENDVIGTVSLGGAIYGATDKNGNQLAVKVIKINNITDFSAENEAKVMNFIVKEHIPNTVQLISYYYNDSEKKLYLVMKRYLGTLGYLIKRNLVTNERAERMAFQLFEAMAGLHRVGVFHGDLTKFNIFYDSEYNLFVGDFGFSVIGERITEKFYSSESVNFGKIEVDYEALHLITFNIITGKFWCHYKSKNSDDDVTLLFANKGYLIDWSKIFLNFKNSSAKNKMTIPVIFDTYFADFKQRIFR